MSAYNSWKLVSKQDIEKLSTQDITQRLICFEGKSTNSVCVFIAFDELGSKDKIARFRYVVSCRQINKDKSIRANQVVGIADTLTEAAQIAFNNFQEELKNHIKKLNI